jgi:hypothetical protein
MKLLSPVVLGLSLAVAGSMLSAAQDSSSTFKVLQITREDVKPGKGGAHNKTESAFVQAMIKSKFPANYIALNAMSGRTRVLYLTLYDSFADWEKDNKIVDNNPTLSAELERASAADGELLDNLENIIFTFESDASLKPRSDLSHARYMEMSVFHVRGGHRDDWNKLVKLVKEGHEKAGTSAHWSMYEVAYGSNDGTHMVLSADDSMADIDTGFAENKKFSDALGPDKMKEMRDLSAAAIESSYSQLFSINPKQSYPKEEWVKNDPDFWKPAAPKPAAAAKPDAAKKP